MSTPQCCLCEKLCESKYGNNPEPLVDMSNKVNHHLRCCDVCNRSKVIPARISYVRWSGKLDIDEERRYRYI